MIFKISLFLTLVLALFPLDAVTVTASSIPSDSDPGLAGSYSGLATVTVGNTVSDQQWVFFYQLCAAIFFFGNLAQIQWFNRGGGYCPVASNGNGAVSCVFFFSRWASITEIFMFFSMLTYLRVYVETENGHEQLWTYI